ncbi:MAG: C40 family peptidase, partial [Lachnospiraceae bacterium]|nr:C40 family peptidase [Lachnospiraceae bacterium]
MKKRLLALVLVVTMVLGSTQVVSASKLQQAQQGLNNAKEQISQIENQQAALQQEIDALDAELVQLLVDIDVIKDEIAAKQAELKQAQEDLKVAQEEQASQYAAMKKRIVYMYENGNISIIQALIEADSFTDMINRVTYFNEVYTYDRKLLEEYKQTVLEVENLIAQVEEDEAELEEIKLSYEEQQAALEAKINEKEASMDNFDSQLADAKALANRYRNTIEEQNRIIAQQQQQQQNNNSVGSGGSSNSGSNNSGSNSGSGSSGGKTEVSSSSRNGQAVVDYASQFVGNKYVYGGNSLTNGIDCSGFVQQVYKHFGVRLPRTSGAQRSAGRGVSVSDIQPGDIVCYSGHVEIYAVNGQIVHASNSKPYQKGGIKYSRYNYRTI